MELHCRRDAAGAPKEEQISMKRAEKDLVDFIDTAPIGLHRIAPDGTILWANPADYGPLGYSETEYIGRNIVEFHSDRDAIADILRRLTAGERLHNYEAHLRCKDGSTRKVLIASSVRRNDAGEFLHTCSFTMDISNRPPEGAEIEIEALSREVERLSVMASRERGLVEALLRHSPHGIIVSDAKGKLVLQNKASEKIWAGSATADSIAGWGKYRAFHPDGRPFEATDWSMARALTKREITEAEEIHFQRFDDTHGVMIGSSAPIFGADGEIEGGISIFTDISKLKQQEEDLRIGAERYFTTLKSIGDAVIATDAVGRITFLNPIAEILTRWSLDDARGKPLAAVFRIVNEQTRAPVESPVDKVIRDGKIVGLANHTVLIARDGTATPIDDSGAPIFDARGELAGVVLVFRDVTEKRREEDRRRFINEASALLASSLDYVPTLTSVAKLSVPTIADWCAVDIVESGGPIERLAVAHVDPAKVRWAKELAKRYPPDPRSAHGVHEVIRTGVSQLMSEIPEALLLKAAVDEEHLRLIRELGLKSSMVVPLRSRGKILGAITFVSAESGRKFGPADLALAEELASVAALAVENARLYREAQNANRTKDEFLATVSHELRTPLNAMLGWAHLLRTSEMSEEKQDNALETIERNARAQSQLIEDLLDVSRIISGNLRLEVRSLDLATLIEAAIDAVRLAADTKGVRLQFLLEEDARHATGDPVRLQQVVWNLLSNAVKFTDRGGAVTVRLRRKESQAEIQVTDTGRGIEPDLLPHIFERFKQAKGATTRSHGGLGLGLAIVKHLVELQGGTVTAASAGAKQGSSFCVRLPLSAVQLHGVATSVTTSSRIIAPALDGLRVLVVDDEPDARTLLVAVLESHGAEVTAVSSAAGALREIELNPPDVLVSDIGMPDEDGYSLIRKVRVLMKKSPNELPAAAVTAFARTEDRSRAMLAGFQSHVAKPVEPDELLIVVATLAGRTGGWPGSDSHSSSE
jgi:PAS domain S-box-containing protein